MPKAHLVTILYKTKMALGEQRCEILRLFFEESLPPDQVRLRMGLNDVDYAQLVAHPLFKREFDKQNKFFLNSSRKLAAREKKSKSKKAKNALSLHERLEKLAPTALEVLEAQMNSPSDSIRQKAALEVLDRAGYVKVEKRVNLQVSAEEVIKELNRHSNEILDAEVVEVKKIDGPITDIAQ